MRPTLRTFPIWACCSSRNHSPASRIRRASVTKSSGTMIGRPDCANGDRLAATPVRIEAAVLRFADSRASHCFCRGRSDQNNIGILAQPIKDDALLDPHWTCPESIQNWGECLNSPCSFLIRCLSQNSRRTGFLGRPTRNAFELAFKSARLLRGGEWLVLQFTLHDEQTHSESFTSFPASPSVHRYDPGPDEDHHA